ncbi:NAD(P)-dependent oxidoreductase, partial [Actinoplanes xinjiangensis]
LIAYDPYVQPARAAQLGVHLVGLDELLRESDFVSVHLPRTPETVGLIGEKELNLVKPGVRIVNAARGGLVDERALAEALADGRVAGAGLDVFETEPLTSSPLFALDNVVVTPHLGASTVEAQDKAGLAVARSVRLALRGEFVPDAVNVRAGGPVDEDVRPLLPLAEKLGRVLTAVAGHLPERVTVEVHGAAAGHDVSVLELAVLKGLFAPVVSEPVTYVNATRLAAERGVTVQMSAVDEPEDLLRVHGALPDGRGVTVAGTLGVTAKLVEVDGFDLDLPPDGVLVFFTYTDRPGVVGALGMAFGEAEINIAAMQVARRAAGGEALMALTVDSTVSPELLTGVAAVIGASRAAVVDLRAD